MRDFLEDMKMKARCFYETDTRIDIMKVMLADGSMTSFIYRVACFCRDHHLGLFTGPLLAISRVLAGCVIGRGAHFGPGLVLMHPVGVVINGAVTGGRNIVIESGVVIGAARNGFPVEVPALGDDIFIGAGAKLLGGIRIGNRCIIGANAVVLSDVPDGATAVGIPAKIVKVAPPVEVPQ